MAKMFHEFVEAHACKAARLYSFSRAEADQISQWMSADMLARMMTPRNGVVWWVTEAGRKYLTTNNHDSLAERVYDLQNAMQMSAEAPITRVEEDAPPPPVAPADDERYGSW